MNVEEIRIKLNKKAVVFKTGGFRPTHLLEEHWIGAVPYSLQQEQLPVDENGIKMIPLLQINLEALPYVPDSLKAVKLISVFISLNFKPVGENLISYFCIREYAYLNKLIFTDYKNEDSFIKPCPMSVHLVEEDSPMWDSADIPTDISDEILLLEEQEEVDYEEDIAVHHYETKVGGYGSYIQGHLGFPEGFDFAFQISSDEKANLNIVSNGRLYFARNSNSGAWYVDCDFF
ncbi:DUF1963 domain-containing protein [Enterococcus sp. LJL128]